MHFAAITYYILAITYYILVQLEYVYCRQCLNSRKDANYGQPELNSLKLERAKLNFESIFDSGITESDKTAFLSSNGSFIPKLGRCAVVGLSERLLHQSDGDNIDTFDTVIRFGWQPSQLSTKIGQKTTYVFARKRPHRTYKHLGGRMCDLSFERWNTLPQNTKGNFLIPSAGIFYTSQCSLKETGSSFRGIPTWRMTTVLRHNVFAELVPFLDLPKYAKLAKDKTFIPRPTSGANFVYSLYKSNLCQSIDLFGFADRRYSGHVYEKFKPSQINSHRKLSTCMKYLHCLDCESFLYAKLSSVTVN